MPPDFLGLGVEKAATSWIFACLYEHPETCIPVKEINFFTEPEKWERGTSYYESIWRERCEISKKCGEFSTAYFYHPAAAERIYTAYPAVQLMVCLRNPMERAFSNYLNDIKAGTIDKEIPFYQALKTQPYYLEQGKYREQMERYFRFFPKEQILVLLYDDLQSEPKQFIQSIYRYLGLDAHFVPPSLHQRINEGRVPERVAVEQLSNRIAQVLQRSKVGERLWWIIKRSGIPGFIRKFNTASETKPVMDPEQYQQLRKIFEEDKKYVEELLDRKLDW